MEKQDRRETKLMGECSTSLGVRSAPSTSAVSAEVGEVGLAATGIVGGLRGSESIPRSPSVLPGRSERSFEAGGRNGDFWVLQESPEVGEMVYCSLVQMKGGGKLLVAW